METNLQHYQDDLLNIIKETGSMFSLRENGKLMACANVNCEGCKFHLDQSKSCFRQRKDWINAEYQEVDWSKVKIDTPIYVRDDKHGTWYPRHFAKYKDGIVYAFDIGQTSWSTDIDDIRAWTEAKLPKEEEEKSDER